MLIISSKSFQSLVEGVYLEFKVGNKEQDWEDFVSLYKNSLKRVHAEKKWYMNDSFFETARLSSQFSIYLVYNNIKIVSATLYENTNKDNPNITDLSLLSIPYLS